MKRAIAALMVMTLCGGAFARTQDEILNSAPASDWRAVDPENTLYMDLPKGRVVIELAPAFAPNHVVNVKTLTRQKYYDGLAVIRLQDNYVAQWADPESKRDVGKAQLYLPPEFARPIGDLPFTALPDVDTYAPQVGFTHGFPTARNPDLGLVWLAHCYAMVGAGRAEDANTGGGTELYAVIGHAPRHLDRNVTLFGRILQGVSLLSSLPRGTGDIGFYKTPAEYTPITSIRVAADVPDHVALEALRTDSKSFAELLDVRRSRRDEWFKEPTNRIELCNVPLPVREKK